MKLPGCPGRSPDGLYRIVDWEQFINNNFASADLGSQPEKLKLTNEKLELEIKKLRFDLSIRQREYSSNAEIKVWTGNMVMQTKRVLLAMPGKLAPILGGLSEVEIERTLKEELYLVLVHLSSDPSGEEHSVPGISAS
jgi:hypothetical protein